MKKNRAVSIVITALVLFCCARFVVAASSTTTTTTVKDGRKITTKVKTDNDGVATTTVTVKEKDGTVTTTTTVADKDGNIISTDDPEARAKAEQAKNERQEKQAALASAPKRRPDDPIQVALFQTVVSEDLRKATIKDGVFPYLRKEFDNDPVILAMDQAQVDRYASDYDFRTGRYKSFSSFDRGPAFLPADVYVESFAKIEEKVGINRTTHKPASAPFLVYTATITSEYGDRPLDVSEEGFILNNLEVTRKFAEKIKAAVRDAIGPTIPRDAARFRRGTEGVPVERINASEALRNLFKKK
jgi:major membrane immunogen (membrane-anchored lipoprotein)